MKMHDREISTDALLVRNLLKAQFKSWADLPIQPIKSNGTDNVIYRLGSDKYIRLPRIPDISPCHENEQWLAHLASHLPLPIPQLLERGEPDESYPGNWAIYRWLEGDDMASSPIKNMHQAAIDLAQFINALRRIDPTGGPSSRRGCPLLMKDAETRTAIQSLSGIIDTQIATAAWEKFLHVPRWDKAPVWVHGDLLPANILAHRGKVSAVIDFDMLGVGDPACDLLPAWSLFSAESRNTFRQNLEIDEATWLRGRGWALSIGLIILPYYMNTNPGLVAVGKRLVREALDCFNQFN